MHRISKFSSPDTDFDTLTPIICQFRGQILSSFPRFKICTPHCSDISTKHEALVLKRSLTLAVLNDKLMGLTSNDWNIPNFKEVK